MALGSLRCHLDPLDQPRPVRIWPHPQGACRKPLLCVVGAQRHTAMACMLDDKFLFKPVVNLFCEQVLAWVVMPEGTEKLPRYYT